MAGETALSAKYTAYSEYMDSGNVWIGDMPAHWRQSRVKHIGKIIGGYAFKSEDFIDQGINAIKISNVSHLSFDWTDSSYLPIRFLEEQSDYIPPNGSLLFAMTRPIISGGVKVARLQDERTFLVNQRVGFLKPSIKVNQSFLMYVTQSVRRY
jgi:type I restriction enzyme S subunit